MNGFCCDNQGQPGTIYQSADTALQFQLKKETCPGGPLGPFDLTSATEIWVLFQTLVNPPVILKLSLSQLTVVNPPGAGIFTGIMSKTNALLLALGLINVEIRVTIAGEITTVELPSSVNVVASLFPGF